jgi:hypothetical protein
VPGKIREVPVCAVGLRRTSGSGPGSPGRRPAALLVERGLTISASSSAASNLVSRVVMSMENNAACRVRASRESKRVCR